MIPGYEELPTLEPVEKLESLQYNARVPPGDVAEDQQSVSVEPADLFGNKSGRLATASDIVVQVGGGKDPHGHQPR